jgi:hypothetical protein
MSTFLGGWEVYQQKSGGRSSETFRIALAIDGVRVSDLLMRTAPRAGLF